MKWYQWTAPNGDVTCEIDVVVVGVPDVVKVVMEENARLRAENARLCADIKQHVSEMRATQDAVTRLERKLISVALALDRALSDDPWGSR